MINLVLLSNRIFYFCRYYPICKNPRSVLEESLITRYKIIVSHECLSDEFVNLFKHLWNKWALDNWNLSRGWRQWHNYNITQWTKFTIISFSILYTDSFVVSIICDLGPIFYNFKLWTAFSSKAKSSKFSLTIVKL